LLFKRGVCALGLEWFVLKTIQKPYRINLPQNSSQAEGLDSTKGFQTLTSTLDPFNKPLMAIYKEHRNAIVPTFGR
jgi:hypothetical protein